MNWKKFLTENVLGECWDVDKRPGGDLPNRTYDNFSDLMSLYGEIFKDINKWAVFIVYSNGVFGEITDHIVHWIKLNQILAHGFLLRRSGARR